jgi:molybdopterin-containing oxidoreductase family iron-sulfur binding subunit
MKAENKQFDLAAVREKLSSAHGERYWRCLEELADSEVFEQLLREDHPRQASALLDSLDRRGFLKLMGASLALAGLSGCLSPAPARNDEKIVPYVNQPEEIVPGRPLYFASAMPLAGFGRGILVESHMGRPTKIEGNPSHPASLGAADVFMQASILDLYDPDRAHVLSHVGRIATWESFFASVNGEMEAQRQSAGAGLAILSETVTSPTLSDQLRQLLEKFPKARWYRYDPAARDAARAGAQLAFGTAVDTHYRFDRAEVILSLDGDFLFFGPAALRYARDFTDKRRVSGPQSGMNRLYVAESTPTVTGSMADHRWALGSRALEAFAFAVARGLGVANSGGAAPPDGIEERAVNAVVRDLQSHRGRGIIVAGDHQPASLHALAHAMNQALGNTGATVIHTEPVEAQPVDHGESLRELVGAMQKGAVQTLVILGGNPVYTAPAELKFAELLARVQFTVHLSSHDNETSALCRWRVPEAHYLESWSDVRAFDGTASIIQPLIAPLYGGRTAHELLAALMGQSQRNSYEIVRGYWQQRSQARGGFEPFWRAALHDGVVPESAAPPRQVSAKPGAVAANVGGQGREAPQPGSGAAPATGSLEVLFRPDPTILDGRFANNGWLQELPKPFTKITWDNVILISPASAQKLGLGRRIGSTGGERGSIYADTVELECNGRRVRGAAWILPGQADDCLTVHLGYGRTRAGRVGNQLGFDANAIRSGEAPWQVAGAILRKVGEQYPVACTQFHQMMEGRELIRSGTLERYRGDPEFAHAGEKDGHEGSLYPRAKSTGEQWGMTIDLNSCIGCNACVVACVAENNIPVVGKPEVMRGREMHWLRVDRYYKGGSDNPEMHHQPVPCMQCENAPCELVCPTHATTHSDDGLNDMTYNRCVGTRYCSNNCPYKVRRFNFFQYQDFTTPSLKLMRNPDVTVRSLGVMEKCTYCVQRIRQGQIEARKEDRAVHDGEITTACEQACPAKAIVFGDINDPDSRVTKLKAGSLNYGLLTELNTRPRTTYLARLKNPNPELVKE